MYDDRELLNFSSCMFLPWFRTKIQKFEHNDFRFIIKAKFGCGVF